MAKEAPKAGKPPSMKELLKQAGAVAPKPVDISTKQLPATRTTEEAERLRDAVIGIEQVRGEVAGLKMIPASLIDENPLPQRSIYLDEEVRAIAESMKANEQRDPIHVRPNPEIKGRYIIADGWTRVLATRMFGAEMGLPQTLEARVKDDLDDLQGCLHGYLQNEERNALADIDKGLLFHKLVVDRKMTNRDVAKMFGVKSESDMSLFTSFGKLSQGVIALIGPHKATFSKSFAYEVAKIQKNHGEKAGLAATMQVIGKQMSIQDIKLLNEKINKAAAVGSQYLDSFLDRLIDGEPAVVDTPKSSIGTKKERFSEHCVLTDKGSQVDIKLSKLDPAQKAILLDRIRPILIDIFQG